jgi:hypothetical protein
LSILFSGRILPVTKEIANRWGMRSTQPVSYKGLRPTP